MDDAIQEGSCFFPRFIILGDNMIHTMVTLHYTIPINPHSSSNAVHKVTKGHHRVCPVPRLWFFAQTVGTRWAVPCGPLSDRCSLPPCCTQRSHWRAGQQHWCAGPKGWRSRKFPTGSTRMSITSSWSSSVNKSHKLSPPREQEKNQRSAFRQLENVEIESSDKGKWGSRTALLHSSLTFS